MKAVIIAAGQSSRLWETTQQTPKTLLPYGRGTILSTIISNLKRSGVDQLIMVVGWKQEEIVGYVEAHQGFGVPVEFVENPQWRRGNGLSVLAAAERVGNEPFILSMCDHLVPPSAVRRVVRSPRKENLLLVDPRVDEIFDIDDATKVQVKGRRITAIGKELREYNGIDCGIFRLDERFFRKMREQQQNGLESISAGVTGLIADGCMTAVFMRRGERWIDIDTPEAYQFALSGEGAPSGDAKTIVSPQEDQ